MDVEEEKERPQLEFSNFGPRCVDKPFAQTPPGPGRKSAPLHYAE